MGRMDRIVILIDYLGRTMAQRSPQSHAVSQA